MNILTVTGACVLGGVAGLVIRQFNREAGTVAVTIAGAGVFIVVLGQLAGVLGFVAEITADSAMNGYVGVLVKALGIAFVSYLGSEICKSLGESGLSGAVELAGKVGILVVCIPIIRQVLGFGTELLFG